MHSIETDLFDPFQSETGIIQVKFDFIPIALPC